MGLFGRRYCFFYRLLRGCTGFWVKILFFFLTDAIASFIGHYGVEQDSRSEFYFFFVTDTIASVIGYYGVAEDSGSKSFF